MPWSFTFHPSFMRRETVERLSSATVPPLFSLSFHRSGNLGGNASSSTRQSVCSVYTLRLLPLPNVNINHLIVGPLCVCVCAFRQMFLGTSTRDAAASVLYHTEAPTALIVDVKTPLLSRCCLYCNPKGCWSKSWTQLERDDPLCLIQEQTMKINVADSHLLVADNYYLRLICSLYCHPV